MYIELKYQFINVTYGIYWISSIKVVMGLQCDKFGLVINKFSYCQGKVLSGSFLLEKKWYKKQ